jgi:hypothetical protein
MQKTRSQLVGMQIPLKTLGPAGQIMGMGADIGELLTYLGNR